MTTHDTNDPQEDIQHAALPVFDETLLFDDTTFFAPADDLFPSDDLFPCDESDKE